MPIITTKPTWAANARTGPLRRHKQQVYFACEGLVVLYDERYPDEDYNVLTPSEWEHRARGLEKTARKMRSDVSVRWMYQEGRKLQGDCQGMLEAAREARRMGDPSDPAVQAFWARHRRRKSVTLSAGVDRAGYPDLPHVDRGPRTGRTAAADDALPLVADPKLRKKPTKKPRNGLILGELL